MIVNDIYFFDENEALKEAQKRNKVKLTFSEGLQLCYYSGEKIESDLKNLIYLPLESIKNFFLEYSYRFPKELNFNNSVYQHDPHSQKLIVELFDRIYNEIEAVEQQLLLQYSDAVRKYKVDFHQKPWKFFILANKETKTQYYFLRLVEKKIKEHEDVFLLSEKSDTDELIDEMKTSEIYKKLSEYKPHATIFLNYINNQNLNENAINIVMYSSFSSEVINRKYKVRQNDIVFSQNYMMSHYLDQKNITYEQIPFFVDSDEFKNNNLERKEKLIYVFPAYNEGILDSELNKEFLPTLKKYMHTNQLSIDTIEKFADEVGIDFDYIFTDLIPNLYMYEIIDFLTANDLKYDIEIYGAGWEKIEKVKKYYKGAVKDSTHLVELFNGAKWMISHDIYNKYTENVVKAIMCGCSPIYFNAGFDSEGSKKDNLYEIDSLEELKQDLLNNTTSVDRSHQEQFIHKHSITAFVNKILEKIKSKV